MSDPNKGKKYEKSEASSIQNTLPAMGVCSTGQGDTGGGFCTLGNNAQSFLGTACAIGNNATSVGFPGCGVGNSPIRFG